MLMRSWLVAASVVGGVVGFSFALPDCLVGDDFSSGGLTDIWQVGQTSGSVISAVESGGQVRFSATANNDMSYDVTYVFSDGWYMDMTSNWAVSGWWYSNPPTPSYGDTGIALGVNMPRYGRASFWESVVMTGDIGSRVSGPYLLSIL